MYEFQRICHISILSCLYEKFILSSNLKKKFKKKIDLILALHVLLMGLQSRSKVVSKHHFLYYFAISKSRVECDVISSFSMEMNSILHTILFLNRTTQANLYINIHALKLSRFLDKKR